MASQALHINASSKEPVALCENYKAKRKTIDPELIMNPMEFMFGYFITRKDEGVSIAQELFCGNCVASAKSETSAFFALYDEDVLGGYLDEMDLEDPEGLFDDLV